MKQIARETAEKSEAEDSTGCAFFRNLYHELLGQVLVRNRLLNVMLAGRDTTAWLLSWTLSVKSHVCVARPTSKPLVQRIVRTKCISLASIFFTQTLLGRPGAYHGAHGSAYPRA